MANKYVYIFLGIFTTTLAVFGILSIITDDSEFLPPPRQIKEVQVSPVNPGFNKGGPFNPPYQESKPSYSRESLNFKFEPKNGNYEISPGLAAFQNVDTTDAINQTRVEDEMARQIQSYIYLDPTHRLEAHVSTDKVIYRPLDVVFIEVLVLNTFNKTPVGIDDLDYYLMNLYMYLEIEDPSGSKIFNTYDQVRNSTLSFTYKVPQNASGGEYTIKIFNYNQMAYVKKIFRIRDYARDQLQITCILNMDSYKPGDLVKGQINMKNNDGGKFLETPSYDMSVDLKAESLTKQNQKFTIGTDQTEAVAFFQIQIPQNTSVQFTSIGFKIKSDSITQTFSKPLVIAQPDNIVIDFYSETGVPLSYEGLPNRIYFQAFSNSERTDFVDFEKATLFGTTKKSEKMVILSTSISTSHKGKGMFEVTMSEEYEKIWVEIEISSRKKIERELVLRFTPLYQLNNEVIYKIFNDNKVLNNDEQLQIGFYTSSRVDPSDVYLIQVKLKENVLYTEALTLKPSSTSKLIIPSTKFATYTGGVLQLSLYKLTSYTIYYDQKIGAAEATTTSGFAPGEPTPGKPNEGQSTDPFPPKIIPPEPQQWLEPRGEIIFFKKPYDTLKLVVTTDRDTYSPGDTVSYTVECIDSSTNKTLTNEAYISMTVTDESVFRKIEDKKLPPSLAAQVYLEHEVVNNDFMFYYANQYINHIFTNGSLSEDSKPENLDLLLGVQGWRRGYFNLDMIANTSSSINDLSEEEVYALENLYGFRFYHYVATNSTGWGWGNGDDVMMPVFNMAGGAGNGAEAAGGVAGGAVQKNNLDRAVQPTGVGRPPVDGGNGQTPIVGEGESELDNQTSKKDFMDNIEQNARNYSHQLRKGFKQSERIDFTETIFYGTAINTKNGKISGKFVISDLITQFRLTANAFDPIGRIGFQQQTIQSQKQIYVDFDLPTMFTVSDELNIDVIVKNNGKKAVTVLIDVGVYQNSSSTPDKQEAYSLTVEAESSKTYTTQFQANMIIDDAMMKVELKDSESADIIDSLTKYTKIIPKGFPKTVNFGGLIASTLNQTTIPSSVVMNFTLPKSLEKDTLKIDSRIMLSNYGSLVQAIEALIKDPYGCFEQTSATTYPMVMGLQFLKAMQNQSIEIQQMTMQMEEKLKKGYDKLISFRTKEKGYEWFGESPAHEALSAYGLMQFTEMANATEFVDADMVADLKQWLLSRKDSSGSFHLNPKTLDTFGGAPQNITDAYIIWALTSSGVTDVSTEITKLMQIVDQPLSIENGGDSYMIGLLAASLYNVKQKSTAQKYAEILKQFQDPTEGYVLRSKTTIVCSGGTNLQLETTAIAVISWLNDHTRYSQNINSAVKWIVKQVKAGRYGSTQATILSLKALTTYMKTVPSLNGDGQFALYINNQAADTQKFTSDRKEQVQFNLKPFINQHSSDIFKKGNQIDIKLTLERFSRDIGKEADDDFQLNYYLTASYYDTQPELTLNHNLDFKISLLTEKSLIGASSNQGKIVSYEVKLSNKQSFKAIGMTVAIVRAPSCLEIDFNYLERLKDNKVFDYYEVRNDNTEIVMYWRYFQATDEKSFTVNLIQRYVGQCYMKPHTAYEYYNDDYPIWITI